jgi:hypothetical protein
MMIVAVGPTAISLAAIVEMSVYSDEGGARLTMAGLIPTRAQTVPLRRRLCSAMRYCR